MGAVVVALLVPLEGIVSALLSLLFILPTSDVSRLLRSITLAIPSNKNPFGHVTVPDGGNRLSTNGDIAVLLFK